MKKPLKTCNVPEENKQIYGNFLRKVVTKILKFRTLSTRTKGILSCVVLALIIYCTRRLIRTSKNLVNVIELQGGGRHA